MMRSTWVSHKVDWFFCVHWDLPSGWLQVAGGEEHDLPLSDQDNRDLLDQLEAASAHASNDIVLQDFKSYAKDDLVFKGASHNPHSPVAIDIVHLPLMSELSKKALKTIRPLLKARLSVICRCVWMLLRNSSTNVHIHSIQISLNLLLKHVHRDLTLSQWAGSRID